MIGLDVSKSEVDLHLVVYFEVARPLVVHLEVVKLHIRVPVSNITEEYYDRDLHLLAITELMYVPA